MLPLQLLWAFASRYLVQLAMSRLQLLLIVSTILGSWLAMQAIHELGHVCAAWFTGGRVERVVLHPFTISRTDFIENRNPLFVVWAGPIFGVIVPLIMWMLTALAKIPSSFVLRFFAGFCLIANGLYIGVGSFDGIGDSGEMLVHGSSRWQLWLFGALTLPIGLWLWHRQGPNFGLGEASGHVDKRTTYATCAACVLVAIVGFAVGGE